MHASKLGNWTFWNYENLNPPKFEVGNFENWKSDNFKAVRDKE